MTQRILTGMQCTSDQFHIGNYFGAAKPMLDLAKKFPKEEVFMFIANMHSFNVIQNGEELKKNAIATMKLYLACGMDPKQFFFYNQADVPAHTQLLRILMCITHMGFMERMHKYKDLQQKGKASEINI
jgi:tryptophanyl-tRNA synthetase